MFVGYNKGCFSNEHTITFTDFDGRERSYFVQSKWVTPLDEESALVALVGNSSRCGDHYRAGIMDAGGGHCILYDKVPIDGVIGIEKYLSLTLVQSR